MDKNFPLKLWDNQELTIDRAVELLDLVDEAHNLFDATKRGWDFRKGDLPTEQNNLYFPTIDLSNDFPKYEILLLFGDMRPKRFLGIPLGLIGQFRKEFAGFIAKSKNSDDVYLVFRGTLLFYEWINNFRFIQRQSNAKACPKLNIRKNQQHPDVHQGFLDTYTSQGKNENSSMQSQIEEYLKELTKKLTNDKTNYKLWITGHSRGGALAMLAAAFIRNNKDIKPSSICLCTQAQPRVGDENFALNFQDSNSISVYRIANSEDIVPVVPLASFVFTVMVNIPVVSRLLRGFNQKLSRKSNFEHNGLPYYFSKQKNAIAENHTIPVYKEALWEAKLNQLIQQQFPDIYVKAIITQQYKDTKEKILDSDLKPFFDAQPNVSKQLSTNRYLKGSLSNDLKFVIFPSSIKENTQLFEGTIMIFPNNSQWGADLITNISNI